MSDLEDIARRLLAPLVLGQPGAVEAIDLGRAAIPRWPSRVREG